MVTTIEGNGNRTFGVRNKHALGTWYSANVYAMHEYGHDYAELRVSAKSGTARFDREELLRIAKQLIELAEGMPATPAPADVEPSDPDRP